MSIKNRVRSWIAARNGSPIAAVIASTAAKYLNAYHNYANWDMALNGELRALRRLIAETEGEVFDVGANTGQWASAVLPFLGDKRLHIFEPVPPIYAELARKVKPSDQVIVNSVGLSDAPGTVTINYSPGASTISSAYPLIYDDIPQSALPCEFTTGDLYMAEHGVDRIAVLKIDVEGMEMAVLAGFVQAFAAGTIAAVQFEHGPSHIFSGHTLLTFYRFFDERGFDLFHVHPHKLAPLHYTLERDSFAGQNLIAIRRDVRARLGL